jgi:hypothetical protein
MGRRALGKRKEMEEVDPRTAQAGSPIALLLFDLLADPTSTLRGLLRVSDLFCVRLTCKEAWKCIQHRPLTRLGVLRAARDQRGFEYHVPLVRWCWRNGRAGVHKGVSSLTYFRTIGKTGDVALVSEVLEVEPKREEAMRGLLFGAARAGHDELAPQLWAELVEMPFCDPRGGMIKQGVAAGGCLRTAAAINDNPRAWVSCLQLTLEKGHQPFAEWVLADVKLNSDAQYVAVAATSGSLELVKWLYAKGYPVGGDAMRNAASSGNVALCEWVLGHGIGPTQDTMKVAVEWGHVEVLEWLSAQGCSCTSELLRHAVRTGGVPVVAWCLDHHTHPPDAGDLLALSCKNKRGSDVFEYLADQRRFQSSPTELMGAAAEHYVWMPRVNFDAAILVKRYHTPLYSRYVSDAIYYDDLGRLRFALSQGQEVSMDCYKMLMMKRDPTLLNEVLLARKMGGSIPEVDRKLIKEALRRFEYYENVSNVVVSVLADYSIDV